MAAPENVGQGGFGLPEKGNAVWLCMIGCPRQTGLRNGGSPSFGVRRVTGRLVIMQSLGLICRNSGLLSAWGEPHFEKVCSKVLIQLNEILKKTNLYTEIGVSSQRITILYTWLEGLCRNGFLKIV